MVDGTPDGWLLAIDTSAITASVALAPVEHDLGEPGAELTWKAGRNQTATLLGQIDGLFRLCGITPDRLGAVAVAIGPGSFNALRVGLSVAKGFAFANGVPILGVGTLDAAAQAFAGLGHPVRAFVDAGRRRIVVGDYRLVNGTLMLQGALEHRLRDELADGLIEPTILAGDLPEELSSELATHERVILPPVGLRRRRAAGIIDIATPRWRAGECDDLVALEPLYIHSRPRRQRSGKRSS